MDKEDVRRKALEKSRDRIEGEAEADQLVLKAVRLLDEAEGSTGRIVEQFRNFYSLHFPELVREIDDDSMLLELVSEEPSRDENDRFGSLAEESKGKDLEDGDLEVVGDVAEGLRRIEDVTGMLEEFIEEKMEEEMPNLGKVLGPMLGARVISLSGGLEELAKSPASTVQVLGAEKALFRHKSGEGSSPKHGILFHHSFVSSLSEDRRGKMARFLANKVVMAARLDFYGEKDKGGELREECREKFEELKR